jgi:hypothetical protein
LREKKEFLKNVQNDEIKEIKHNNKNICTPLWIGTLNQKYPAGYMISRDFA